MSRASDMFRRGEMDFPCSYTFRAGLTQFHEGIRLPDLEPSPDLPLEELQERVRVLENIISKLSQGEVYHLGLKTLRKELQEIKGALRETQRLLPRKRILPQKGQRRTMEV